MKVAEVKEKAKKVGVKISGMNKTDMIRAIQVAEGNFPCFKTPEEYCDQFDCSWRQDCLSKK